MVSDIVAMFTLVDDSPKYCSHFSISALGNEERTEVYVIPNKEFCDFIQLEKEMAKEGEKLYET
jgi:hypothetical protein